MINLLINKAFTRRYSDNDTQNNAIALFRYSSPEGGVADNAVTAGGVR